MISCPDDRCPAVTLPQVPPCSAPTSPSPPSSHSSAPNLCPAVP
ncbi:unnamed protein product, partial [Staurois parvus]